MAARAEESSSSGEEISWEKRRTGGGGRDTSDGAVDVRRRQPLVLAGIDAALAVGQSAGAFKAIVDAVRGARKSTAAAIAPLGFGPPGASTELTVDPIAAIEARFPAIKAFLDVGDNRMNLVRDVTAGQSAYVLWRG